VLEAMLYADGGVNRVRGARRSAWESRLSPTMRQAHPTGERMFVYYAGQTADLIDGSTGEIRLAQLFVAVVGSPITPCRSDPDPDFARLDRAC